MFESAARRLAIEQLERVNPLDYGRSRNFLDGAVTRLSRFLRHGVLSLAEVRDAVVAKVGHAATCEKLTQELAWRDYFQRVWRLLGDEIWSDLEPYKTGYSESDYADELPADVADAQTGIDYIDQFINQLHSTGYLHNHARMWLAAYVVHGRRVKWQAGARWFLLHLLDGDEASNNLSWQWCASTFSHKPYIFNRENVLKYSGNQFAARQKNDPFDDSYEAIAAKFFRNGHDDSQQKWFDLRTEVRPAEAVAPSDVARTLVWVHDGMMSPAHPAVARGAGHVFVWDDAHLAERRFSPTRIEFLRSALFCPDVRTHGRSLSDVLLDLARAGHFNTIVTGDTADPRVLRTIETLRNHLQAWVAPDRPFVELSGKLDLTRFSRYWSKAKNVLLK